MVSSWSGHGCGTQAGLPSGRSPTMPCRWSASTPGAMSGIALRHNTPSVLSGATPPPRSSGRGAGGDRAACACCTSPSLAVIAPMPAAAAAPPPSALGGHSFAPTASATMPVRRALIPPASTPAGTGSFACRSVGRSSSPPPPSGCPGGSASKSTIVSWSPTPPSSSGSMYASPCSGTKREPTPHGDG